MGVPFTEKLFLQAQQHHMAGRVAEADRLYRKLLANQPNHAGATHFLGLIAHQTGRPADAEALMRRSIALDPRRAEYFSNLGDVLRALHKDGLALESFQRAIALNPRLTNAYANIAVMLINHQRYADAIPWARKAIELQPDHVMATYALAQGLAETGQVDEAKALWKRVLAQQPNDPEARYSLAALEGANAPAQSPATFVTRLFDGYADDFEKHLVNGLGYQVPKILRATIDRIDPQRTFDILDLGCGTGLVGEAFRERAKSLTGVDLAAAMIEKSKNRGVYDVLEQDEVVASLRRRAGQLDLVLAGDVFVYIGDLKEVFAATTQALCADGLFGFSVERHEGEGFILQRSKRYAHSPRYIEALAAENGFKTVSAEEVAIRRGNTEQGVIAGNVFVLQRTS